MFRARGVPRKVMRGVINFLLALATVVATSSASRAAVKEQQTPAALQSTQGQASFLRTEGLQAFESGRFTEAEQLLSRLLMLHPAHSGLGETLLRLGQSRIALNQAHQALSPLRRSVGALKGSPLYPEARLALGQAYLLNGKLTQVQLLSAELVKDKKLHHSLQGEALLLRAEGQIALLKLADARLSLSSAAKITPEPKRLARVALRLKLAQCRQLPSAPRLEEGTFRAELGRRSLCLLESLSLLPALWAKEPVADHSELLQEFRAQRELCTEPLPPVETLKPQELIEYKKELSQVLKKDCAEMRSQVLVLLEKQPSPQARQLLAQLKEAL